MKQLKVLAEFRDKNDFTLRHEVGDTLFLDDEKRAARLVQLGLCEVVGEVVKRVESGELEAESDVPDPAKESGSTDTDAPNASDTSETTVTTDTPDTAEPSAPEEPTEAGASLPAAATEPLADPVPTAKPTAPKGKKAAAARDGEAPKSATRRKKAQ